MREKYVYMKKLRLICGGEMKYEAENTTAVKITPSKRVSRQ